MILTPPVAFAFVFVLVVVFGELYSKESNPSWYFRDNFIFYSSMNALCFYYLLAFFYSACFLSSSSLSVASSLTFRLLYFLSSFYYAGSTASVLSYSKAFFIFCFFDLPYSSALSSSFVFFLKTCSVIVGVCTFYSITCFYYASFYFFFFFFVLFWIFAY